MPRIEVTRRVPVPVEQAFALSQSQGEVRYAWDPFVREQRLLDGADRPARGVRTRTRSRHGLTMVSEYTSFRAPTQVGMKMVEGPWFFSAFGGGWSFAAAGPEATDATWRYTFTVRPSWLAPVADRIGRRLLGRDIERRLAGFARGCADAELVARAQAQLASP
ncbi:SRPBCC family protein [Iamia majanohamensis]|uniref:SRPBCC family protein n=1 Tax=Iamia majanohamensis TaxID=467976 RepID=A0AAE9YJ75_9ACTN|nr:SRPBCC family protein [Iamia majanohamensis]WCO69101.1 SRPBCC family protein [Iamia majanohamensis]